jgi:hypothetical protein
MFAPSGSVFSEENKRKQAIFRMLNESIILKHIGRVKLFNNIEHIERLKD